VITTEFPVALFVRVTLLEVDATVAVEAGIVVLIADSSPVVETPVVMPKETPGTMVEVMVCSVGVDITGGLETVLVSETPVLAPLLVPAVPLVFWAWFGNCQASANRGLRLREKRKFLIVNMMIT
jgi:hypothetical protein